MTDDKKQQKKINALKKALQAADDKKKLKAIKDARDSGNEQLIPVMVELLRQSQTSDAIKEEVWKLLFDLKSQKTVWPLIEEIHKTADRTLKARLISVFWQAGLDMSEYVDELIRWATDDDFFVANEAVTVLENITPQLSEEELMNYLYDISDMVNEIDEDNPRKNLLLALAEILKTYPVE